jgi:hypothetical protein
MKKPISFLLTSVLLFLAPHLFSQEENYDAVYLQLTKEYTLNPDGSMDFRYLKKQKLQTYRSFHNLYGETFIVYHPDFQSLKVNEAYIIMADGKKVSSPANAFNEVLPAFAANAPAYNKLREMVITHSGTERNAVINLDYQVHSAKGFYPCLMGNELLAETEPVKELVLRIRIPSDHKLSFTLLNSKTVPSVNGENSQLIYTWTFTNVPAISTEELQKGPNELYPRLIFSTEADRKDLYADLLKQPAFSYELSGEMKEAVAAVYKENKEKINIALKLQEKVVNEFRLYPVPMRNTGFACRTPQETWNSNGGTLLEKAVLLTALMKEAGFDANPVFLVRAGWFDESVGSLLDIEDIIVRTTVPEEGQFYLSVNALNAQDLRYTSPDRVFVELKKPAVTFAKTPPVTSRIRFDGSFSVNDKQQLSGSITCTETDGANPYLSLLRDKNKAKSLTGGGLSSSDLKEPVTINAGKDESSMGFEVQKDKPFRVDSNYLFFTLPLMTNGIDGFGIHLLPRTRTTPLELPAVMEESYDFSIVIPKGMKTFLQKENVEEKNKTGAFVFEMKQDKEKVIIHRSLKLTKRLILPEEYADFKALMDRWNADRYREVVFSW